MPGVEAPDPNSVETLESRDEQAPDPRFTMANERTFLAWNRTALALIGGGLAVEQFLHTGRTARLALAIPLILLGAALAATSYSRWRANESAMWRGEPLPPSRMPLLVAGSFALLSLGALVLALVHAL
jgi:putative membrane protein